MCGITGMFHYKTGNVVVEDTLTAMRDTMLHRGPDGGDNWISPDKKVGLAHRRLSIIDLTNAANQPMQNEDSTVWITFNGEIYNHAPLRQELVAKGHKFRTDHSDTEVLIHGFEEWGIDGLMKKIEGDYGFAIWDGNKRDLFIVRDRIGVKPLYFSFNNGTFLFGSEIKAILANPAVTAAMDPMAMYHYLSFLTTPAPLTMFEGIYKLPSGFYMKVSDSGEVKATRYWDAVPGQSGTAEETKNLSEQELEDYYVAGIRKRLVEGVEKRMMSDVPIGVFLSGGIDSSTNVALMSKCTSKPLETFTVGFKDHQHLNELDHARFVSETFKTNHHEILIDEKDMMGYLDQLIYQQDEPIADWVCIPLYFVSKLAKDSGVTVVQVGEGSDEQFSGYSAYMNYLRLDEKFWKPYKKWVPQILQYAIAGISKSGSRIKPGFDFYSDIINRATYNQELFWSGATVFWNVMKDKLLDSSAIKPFAHSKEILASGLLPESYSRANSYNVIESFLKPFDKKYPGRDTLTRMTYNEFQLRLPELLLMRVDKIGMSVSIEARVPFLDHHLVEYTMDIPQRLKVKNGEAKYLFKKAVTGIIPDSIINRKKMGFNAPMSEWLRGDFGQKVVSSILASNVMEKGFFKKAYIQQLFDQHRSGKMDNSLYLWSLFNLTAWYDYWIDKKS